jgi:hypothetical protein
MNLSLILQYLLIGLMVFLSLLFMVRKLVPRFGLQWQAEFADALTQPSRFVLVRALGRILQPKQAASSCDSGCSTCDGCGSNETSKEPLAERPITLHPRRH